MAKSSIRILNNNDTTALYRDIVRETEKAVLVRCMYGVQVWLPRSQIEIGAKFIFLPVWLAVAKGRDARADLGTTNEDLARAAELEAAAIAA